MREQTVAKNKRVSIMKILEIREIIKKQIIVIKKTIIKPGLEVIIAIPKKKDNKIQMEEKNG